MTKSFPDISIVIPLYNEEQVFPLLLERLDQIIAKSALSIEVILVDDGSKDSTPLMMKKKAMSNAHYHSIFLSRNYGHQIALSAGLNHVNATEAVMVIDGDLQDPPELLDELYAKYQEGFEVVYAVRKKRKESFLKKLSYFLFYRFIKKISKIDLPLDSGDFALMSRRVVDILNSMPEQSRYLRGMRSWVGFKQVGVEYERKERAAGESKYNLKMLFGLAYNGIFNFSEVPIKFLTSIGFVSILVSFSYLVYSIILRVFTNEVPSGFTALLFVIVLFGGVQLISIGIIGEYIIRTFFQVKDRPLFIVDQRVQDQELIVNHTANNKTILTQNELNNQINIINEELDAESKIKPKDQ